MKVKRIESIRVRRDVFGGICYVPHRDDFFALDHESYDFVSSFNGDWSDVPRNRERAASSLAKLGILKVEPSIKEIAYSGPSFVGRFNEIPTVSLPLVVNCFCTAHCPLSCKYCHADDLMVNFRDEESLLDLKNVVSTTNQIDAMVAVITGGDPLTRPDRANFLLENIDWKKALVLDTSGVGDILPLVGILKDRNVHVRISLDAISRLNDETRPINRAYISDGLTSREYAERTIAVCLSNGIPVTVQTVICNRNENESELMDLRDSLADWGVRHWVLHIAVRGGKARAIEELAAKKHLRKRGILPSAEVYALVNNIIDKNHTRKIPLDIRCTDTENTPNSVLLVGSRGDLYTEGLASNSKVELYNCREGRPDKLKANMHFVDKFGHARRYLNWNRWLARGEDLERICYKVPSIGSSEDSVSVVENEAKFSVKNVGRLRSVLVELGFTIEIESFQRDEYFDTSEGRLSELDYVVRLRQTENSVEAAFKGPRSYGEGTYARIELEIPTCGMNETREYLKHKGYEPVWFFEKRRIRFNHPDKSTKIYLDEIPNVGFFVEIEGTNIQISEIQKEISKHISKPEMKNYRDLFLDFQETQGVDRNTIKGAEFGTG